jgi:chromosome segregation ATPase
LDDQHRSELAQWDKARQELESQRDEAERRRSALLDTVSALQAQVSEMNAQHSADHASWDGTRQELEDKQAESSAEDQSRRASLEQAAGDLEARCAELEIQCRAEKAECARRVAECDQLQADMSAKNETLEKTLATLEAYQRELTVKRQPILVNWDELKNEFAYQRAALLALEDALRAAEARQGTEPFAELAPAAVQAVTEVMGRVSDCGALLTQCLGPEDPCRMRATSFLDSAGQAGKLALRLLALGQRPPDSDIDPGQSKLHADAADV